MSLSPPAKQHLRAAAERAAHDLEDAAASEVVAWADAAVR